MVNQTLDSATLSDLNYRGCKSETTLVQASQLREGQQVLYKGALLRVRRIVPAFTRPQACHVHLVPLHWQRLEGVSPQLADRDEGAVLIRVACSILQSFQVVAWSSHAGSGG